MELLKVGKQVINILYVESCNIFLNKIGEDKLKNIKSEHLSVTSQLLVVVITVAHTICVGCYIWLINRINWVSGIKSTAFTYFIIGVCIPICFHYLFRIVKKQTVKVYNKSLIVEIARESSMIVTYFVIIILAWSMSNGKDHFTKKNLIPVNQVLFVPENNEMQPLENPEVFFKQIPLVSTAGVETNQAIENIRLENLFQLHQNFPVLLKQYFHSSFLWHVEKNEQDKYDFARRKWWNPDDCNLAKLRNRDYTHGWSWPNSQNCFLFDRPKGCVSLTVHYSNSNNVNPKMLSSGKTTLIHWSKTSNLVTSLNQSKMSVVNITENIKRYESRCMISFNDTLSVEVCERAESNGHCFTIAALKALENELLSLVKNPKLSTIIKMVAPFNKIEGKTSFQLFKHHRTGRYVGHIWGNPTEAGMIYLKAFEAKKMIPLSVKRLKKASCQGIGWSDIPSNLFFSKSWFSVIEGDIGHPYLARFEVWFIPHSGASERKLIEKNYTVEGKPYL